MLEIDYGEGGEIRLAGRFDASQAESVREFLEAVEGSRTVDLRELSYISSAGLGVLLAAQKRLSERGGGLRLINVSSHIHDILRYTGFHQIFEIEAL
jgi:anti-sigma B factor antagonist